MQILARCPKCDAGLPIRGDEPAIPPGPWDSWPERDPRDAINIERAALLAAGQDEMPNSMLRAMGF